MSGSSVDNKKNSLWRLLKTAFLKARERVRKKGGASFRARSPEHFAIDVLNEHYGKRRSAKPRDYSEDELDHAIAVAQSEGFVALLEQAVEDALVSREKEFAPAEAQVTQKPSQKAREEPAKKQDTAELQRLREVIERAGGEVRDLRKTGEGLYPVEVATPLAVYTDRGTQEDIVRQVERDVSAARSR
jgi:hypothetical protein